VARKPIATVPTTPETRWTPTTSSVVAELELQADGERGGHTGDDAEGDRTERGDVGTSRGDGDQAGDHTGGGTEGRRVAVAEAFDGEPAEHGGGRGGQGVDPDQAGLLNGRGGTGIEAEPAEPQDGGTEHDERNVVRAVVRVLAEALAVADDQDQDEARDAGVDVDHGATGEVNDRRERLAEPAAGGEETAAPDHEGHRGVDERCPDRGEDHPGGELGTVGDRTGDQGHSDDGERGRVADLEQVSRFGETVEAEVAERVGEDLEEVVLVARGHRSAPQDPHDPDGANGDEAHHHHVQSRLGTSHAAVEEC
jgi:hypothetical protein